MTHPTDDDLLLHAYGELPEERRATLETHLAACAECRARFANLEESRVALAWGLEKPVAASRRGRRLAWLALPLAAGIATFVLSGRPEPEPARPAWSPHLIASPTAGYVTTGFMSLDSQLTRLESGRSRADARN